MTLTHSSGAPSVTTQDLAADLQSLFPSDTLAPFYPFIPLAGVEVTVPFAVYAPTIHGLRSSEVLMAAELNRWRAMLVYRNVVVAWASLRPHYDRLKIIDVNVGGYMERVVSAIRDVEENDAVAQNDYELRFVESPVHAFLALWLASSQANVEDLMIPISDHRWKLQAGAMYDMRTVSRMLAETEDANSCAL